MASKDRVGHTPKRKPTRDPAEHRRERRAERQTAKGGKRKRRTAAARHASTGRGAHPG
jgi:hypothetical protein